MASGSIVLVTGVVRSTRDLTTIRNGRRETFAVSVELLTELPVEGGAGGFLDVTCFINEGELLPSATIGEFVAWAVHLEARSFRSGASVNGIFVSTVEPQRLFSAPVESAELAEVAA